MNKNLVGFTIIEVLISVVILAVVIVGGMGFFINSNRFMVYAKHKKIALEISNAKVENLRSDGYSVIGSSSDSVVLDGLVATQMVTVTPQNVNGEIYKDVQVSVSWNEPGRNGISYVNLETYMAP